MANSFGSLYVGASGIQNSQHGLNVVANNLSNMDTTGYVRQRTFFSDQIYLPTGKSAISNQQTGLGLKIGDVIHQRDQFLDRAYRQESGRKAYYDAAYEATGEVENFLREGEGTAFSSSIESLYDAFSQYATNPAAEEIQNLVVQKSQLFLSRAKSVYQGLSDYQDNVNQKIKDDIDQINSIGKKIQKLNVTIQATEAGGVETAMADRDTRDKLIDDLSKFCEISTKETPEGVVKVSIEGVEFVSEDRVYPISLDTDNTTGFVTPYWQQLSKSSGSHQEKRYVFDTYLTDTAKNQDIGEVKSLLLMRGDHRATYRDFYRTTDDGEMNEIGANEYSDTIISKDDGRKKAGLGKSVIMNAQAELDRMMNKVASNINDLLSPVSTVQTIYDRSGDDSTKTEFNQKLKELYDNDTEFTVNGVTYKMKTDADKIKIMDQDYAVVGADGKLPPNELFSRVVGDKNENATKYQRYSKVTLSCNDGSTLDMYVYNKEDDSDLASQYTLSQLTVNSKLVEQPNRIPYKHLSGTLNSDSSNLHQNDDIAYDIARKIYECWDNEDFKLNPADTTPTTFNGFYTKYIGDLADKGNVYKTTSEVLSDTVESVSSSREGVIGVNADEELENMIKYQNAYNASSRFMNTITSMIDVLLNSLT
ncbi:MAG: flagellar hook-associated protein FlgK [Lachnospiraceae bacterium]|nr:MAG: flagellar hook-associated protein FlgK [Lachnospiraceae bacterium]